MWEVFRTTRLGIAGENVTVVANNVLSLSNIAGGLRIELDHGPIEVALGDTLAVRSV